MVNLPVPTVTSAGKLPDIVLGDLSTRFAPFGSGSGTTISGPGTLRGNRLAVIGDSTARGTYFGDSEPGIKGDIQGTAANVLVPGMSWLTWAAQLSGGRIIRHKNAATIGDSIAGMAARVATDVVPSRPDACVVVSGYNDAFANVSTDAYMVSLRSIHATLKAAGIEMIAATPLPTANSGAAFLAKLDAYSAAIREFAAAQGLQVLDFSTLRDSDGAMIPSIKTNGDGVHPGAAGQIVLGRFVADAILPRLAKSASLPLPRVLGATGNIAPNRFFTGAAVNGLAPSVAKAGAADATVVPSVTTAPFIEGNVQRFTVTGSTAEAIYFQRVQKAAQWDVGDVIAVAAKVTTTGGVDGSVRLEFNSAPFGHMATRITEDATRATVYAEFKLIANVSYFDLQIVVGAGTGTAEFGELAVYNLTKLGLA